MVQSLLARGPIGAQPSMLSPRLSRPARERRGFDRKGSRVRTSIRATSRSCSETATPAEGGAAMRYYIGVDWADAEHAVWVADEEGQRVSASMVPHSAVGFSEWGRQLDEWRAAGLGLWAALEPSSEAAQELKLLTEDYQRQVRAQTRLVNQLTATLKAYYPRALEVAELTTALAAAFLQAYPTPAMLLTLTERQWQRWAKAHHLSAARTTELWTSLKAPHLPVPPHVVRAKSQLMQALVTELAAVMAAVARYRQAIDDFFASMPAAVWARKIG